jgi:hypothetical protein
VINLRVHDRVQLVRGMHWLRRWPSTGHEMVYIQDNDTGRVESVNVPGWPGLTIVSIHCMGISVLMPLDKIEKILGSPGEIFVPTTQVKGEPMSTEGTSAAAEDELTLKRDGAGHATVVDEAPEADVPFVKKEILDAYKVLRNEVNRTSNMHALECELEAVKMKIKTGEEQIRLLKKRESMLEEAVKEIKEAHEKLDVIAVMFKIQEAK